MDNKRIYSISINGISESIDAVAALNKQLDALESRMKTLEKSSSVGVKTQGGGNALSEEEATQREINKLKKEGATLDAKIAAAQDEVFKKVDATKQLYKETLADQKAIAAQERLTADAYSNTMQGMKSKLSDLKAVINTTDLGDSDKIKQMTKEANELTNKLKQMEEAYGQFGRNVGNYKSAADGFKGIRLEIAGTVQEFDNAKQALKTLKQELATLQFKKDQGMLLSEEELKRFEELPSVVAQLQSSIQDAGKPMDALMDSMQSIMAIGQTTKGFSALFGFDDNEINKSIQSLVALQNAMQGIQTISKQMKSGEFMGGLFTKGDAAIKSFTDKLFGVNKAAQSASTAVASVGTAGKTAATGLGTATVAANTATKSFSLATLGATALRVALNAIGIGLIIGAISLAVEGISKLVEKQKEAKKYQEDLNKAVEEGTKAYAKTTAELTALKNRVDKFNGTKKQEKKLVDELNSKYGSALGQYKSLKEWKEALIKKAPAYAEALKTEAEAQAYLNMYTQQFIELEEAKRRQQEKDSSFVGWLEKAVDTVAKGVTKINKSWGAMATGISTGLHAMLDENIGQMQSNLDNTYNLYQQRMTKLNELKEKYGIMDQSDKISKDGQKTKNEIEKVQNEINQLEIRLMEDGLNKKLRQLDEEERQVLNKLKQNGKTTAAEIEKIQRGYAALRAKEIQEYLKNVDEAIKKSEEKIKSVQAEINSKELENKLNKVRADRAQMETLDQTPNTYGPMTSNRDLAKIGRYRENQLAESAEAIYDATRQTYDNLIRYLINYQQEEQLIIQAGIRDKQRQEEEAENKRYNQLFDELQGERDKVDKTIRGFNVETEADAKHLEEMKEQRDDYDKQMQTALDQHMKRMQQIRESYDYQIKQNEIDTQNDISATQEKFYNLQITHYRQFLTKMNDEMNANPEINKTWGVVDVKKTKQNYEEIIRAGEKTIKSINADRRQLDMDLKDGFISSEAFAATNRQLDDLERSVQQGMDVTKLAGENLTRDFLDSAQEYIRSFVTVLQDALGAIWDAQDRAFEKEQEELQRTFDETNEKLQKALDKQEQLIQEHSQSVESIEQELATARGDRRQHLIDQLNAEMEAERTAAKEKKRLEKEQQKEKEKQDKKQEDLDKKRRKAEYRRNIAQAIINGAMAVTYAAMNTWPVPAVAMMKLAAITSAAQLAIVLANKPYAKGGQLPTDGGVAQGKRHSEGGIPVLGGRASIEGGEFITNRQTTAKNVDLLEYINAKHRKLDINDFIDFYSSGNVKKNLTSMSPRNKFADGGIVPTLNSNYEFDDRLMSAFEDYSNRPVVVSVVDINNRQAAVKNIEVLAGLNND